MSIKNGHVRWAFDLRNWQCPLNSLELATSCIQQEEKERIAKFVYRDDFNASLIGRLLMRRFIKTCLPELDYNAIRFERDSRGKPYLSQSTTNDPKMSIDFNVSHHEGYAVLAGTFTRNVIGDSAQQIGVDVMNTEYSGGKPLHEFFRLMHRTFTPNEWKFIRSRSTENEQSFAFMRHWCLKESYVKNIGVGITINLQSIDFQLSAEHLSMDHIERSTSVMIDGEPLHNWMFEESLLDADHCVAVAVKNPSPHYLELSPDEYRFEIIDFETLMQDSVAVLEIDSDYCRAALAKEFKTK